MTTTQTAKTYAIDPAHTTAEFIVRHLMISKVRGRFTSVTGTINVPEGSTVPVSIDVTIDAASIDTREEQRDAHLKSADFLEAEKFGTITFKSTGFDGSGDAFKVRGDLTIHGVTREVVLDTTFEGRTTDPWGNDRIGYEAHTKISRKDHGLGWNQALETGGVLVGDDVKIELNVEAIAQK
ncbi:MAG TPA: YceI family protein [Candidatus Elarobacter sp.]